MRVNMEVEPLMQGAVNEDDVGYSPVHVAHVEPPRAAHRPPPNSVGRRRCSASSIRVLSLPPAASTTCAQRGARNPSPPDGVDRHDPVAFKREAGRRRPERYHQVAVSLQRRPV